LLYILSLVREDLRSLTKEYDKSENDLKALQSVGQVNKNNFS
jgi:26S proteasome regulatory subunit T4